MGGGAIKEEWAWKGLRWETAEVGVAERGVVKAEDDLKDSHSDVLAARADLVAASSA